MHDQANHLRRLVRDRAAPKATAGDRRPRLAVVAGGKGGVGTTTIAVNLAAAIARAGLRAVLVDADPNGGDVAVLCGLEPRYTLADVLSGERTAAEVLQAGPGTVQVLPGAWALEDVPCNPSPAAKRLFGQLRGLERQADLIVIDAGNGPNHILGRVWEAAGVILVVTTPERTAIFDSYALIKGLAARGATGPIRLLVNLASDRPSAESVHARLARTCRRLLGIDLQQAGHVLIAPQVPAAGAGGEPFVVAAPRCRAARRLGRLAREVAASLAEKRTAKSSFRRVTQRQGAELTA